MTKLLNMCLANESNSRKLRLNFVRWSFFVTFATMIQELPIHEDNWTYSYNEPLLDYVCKVANCFWMDYDVETQNPIGYSSMPRRFAHRYLNGEIDVTSKKLYCKCVAPKATNTKHIKYIENIYYGKEDHKESEYKEESITDISLTLKAYGLDCSKFWYLCVFLKDYVTGETIEGARIEQNTHREYLERFVSLVNKLNPELWGTFYKTTGEAELTLKVGKGKNNKLVIDNGHSLALIRDGIQYVLDNYHSAYIDFSEVNTIDRLKKTKGNTVRIALFYKYMLWFLDQCTLNQEVVKESYCLSTSKILLISRLVYILGLSDNKQFLGESSETYLRTYISGYEDVKVNVDNKFYGSGF